MPRPPHCPHSLKQISAFRIGERKPRRHRLALYAIIDFSVINFRRFFLVPLALNQYVVSNAADYVRPGIEWNVEWVPCLTYVIKRLCLCSWLHSCNPISGCKKSVLRINSRYYLFFYIADSFGARQSLRFAFLAGSNRYISTFYKNKMQPLALSGLQQPIHCSSVVFSITPDVRRRISLFGEHGAFNKNYVIMA